MSCSGWPVEVWTPRRSCLRGSSANQRSTWLIGKAVQIRRTVGCEEPVTPAVEPINQWVASAGFDCRVPLDHRGDLIILDRPRPAGPSLIQQPSA